MTTSARTVRLARRLFIQGVAGSAAVALLAACSGEATPTTARSAATGGNTAAMPSPSAAPTPLPTAVLSSPVIPTMLAMPTAPTARPTTAGGSAVAGGATGAAGTGAPPGSLAGTLAASAPPRTATIARTAPPLLTGFVGETPMAMLTGATPPTDLMGRLSVPRLTFAFLPTGDAATILTTYGDLLAYMAKSFGVEVVGVVGPTAADTVDAMQAKAVDAAILSPFAYLLAKQSAFAVPLVQGEAGDGMPAQSSTVLIGRRDGGPNTPADLRGKTIAFVTADPTFGQVLPAYLLATNPRLVESRDYMVLPVPTWADAYSAVDMGRADAAALTTAFFQRGLEAQTIDNNRVKVLDKSPDIPGNLVAARGDLPMADSDALAALLLTINEQPAMSRLVQSTIAPPPNGTGIFGEIAVKLRKAADITYNPARDIAMHFGIDLRALAH